MAHRDEQLTTFISNTESQSRIVADAVASGVGSFFRRRDLLVPASLSSGGTASRDGPHPQRHKSHMSRNEVGSKTTDSVVAEGKACEQQLTEKLYTKRTVVEQKAANRLLQRDNDQVKAREARVEEELTATKHALAEQEAVNRKLQVSSEQGKAREASLVEDVAVLQRALVEQQEANRELQRVNEEGKAREAVLVQQSCAKQQEADRDVQRAKERGKVREAVLVQELEAAQCALEKARQELQYDREQGKAREAELQKELAVMQAANSELRQVNEQAVAQLVEGHRQEVQHHHEHMAEVERLVLSLLDQLDNARRAIGSHGLGKGTEGTAVVSSTRTMWQQLGSILLVVARFAPAIIMACFAVGAFFFPCEKKDVLAKTLLTCTSAAAAVLVLPLQKKQTGRVAG